MKELQSQCLKDSLEYIHEFQEALPDLAVATSATLTRLMKACHSLKGNLQAAGFQHCGQLVHGLESALVGLQDATGAPLAALSDSDAPVLEFLLSDTIQSVEGYFTDLAQASTDSPELYEKRKHALKLVATWKPSGESLALSASQQMAKETSNALATPPAAPNGADSFFTEIAIQPPAAVPAAIVAPPVVASATTQASTPSESRKPETAIYLLCRQDERHFALPIDNVLEIVRFQPIVALPLAPAHYLGALNLRGEILPVIDLKNTLGSALNTHEGYIVVCHTQGVKFGFPVEEAQQVIELKPNGFQSADAMAGDSSGLVAHFALLDDRTIQVLDLDRVLAA